MSGADVLETRRKGCPINIINPHVNGPYSGLQCAVVWNGIVGYRFDVKCGV